MTVLEKFMAFAQALPADRRSAIEATLAAIMESYSSERDLTDAELAEIDRRVAEPSPRFASQAELAELFGKPFGQ